MKKYLKLGLVACLLLATLGAGTAYYLFNLPHRDVQSSRSDLQISVSQLIETYLSDPDLANNRFLSADGDSKILELTGQLHSTGADFNGNTVLIFRDDARAIDVNIYLEAKQTETIPLPGETVRIKGVITSGTAYDEDLAQYTPITIAQALILKP